MAELKATELKIISTKLGSGQDLVPSEREILDSALQSHDDVLDLRRKVAAFDWTTLIKILSPLLALIPNAGPIIAIVNAILALLKINPLPVPNGGGGTIPTPHD